MYYYLLDDLLRTLAIRQRVRLRLRTKKQGQTVHDAATERQPDKNTQKKTHPHTELEIR